MIGGGSGIACRIIHLGCKDVVFQPHGQSGTGLFFQLIRLVAADIAGKGWKDGIAHFSHNRTSLRNHDRIAHGLWNVRKKADHLVGAFEIMFLREAGPVFFGNPSAGPDTHQHIMRHFHIACFKPTIIGCHQRQICLQRCLQQQRFRALFGRQTMTLQFDIDPPRQQRRQGIQPGTHQPVLSIGRSSAYEPPRSTAAKKDQPVRMRGKNIQRDDRVIAPFYLEQCL
ncbi:MAG: Uncharacterised protein [SAR116 cluster bacterium]|nr:MAG: Uncharacterised protein [SAR116 cluster bacterium]